VPDEIILVLDPYPALKKFYDLHMPDDVKIVVSKGYGLSKARNAGVKEAKGKIIAFIDDDAIANKNWLDSLLSNFDDPNVGGVGGKVKPIWKGIRPIFFPNELDWIIGCSYEGLPRCKTNVRNPIGCNMSFRKDILQIVGYFRENVGRTTNSLISGEETDFCVRLLEKCPKLRTVYDPSAIVYHNVPKTRTDLRYLVKRSFYEGFSIAIILNSAKSGTKLLSVEHDYLRYLLRVSIPLRLKGFNRLENIQQLFVLLLSMFSVMVGYSTGRLKK
jgi:GT2 family glycosyltransferase